MNDQAGRADAPQPDETDRQQVLNDFSDIVDVLTRSMVHIFAAELAQHGITILQYAALRAMDTFGPAIDMSSIATKTALPASSVTSIVDRLAQLGLAERHHDERDRRRVVATITPEGSALIDQVKQQELDRLDRTLVDSSDAELLTTLTVLRRVAQRIRELAGS